MAQQWLFVDVRALMQHQMLALRVLFAAVAAGVGFVVGVQTLVPIQARALGKSVAADAANEGLHIHIVKQFHVIQHSVVAKALDVAAGTHGKAIGVRAVGGDAGLGDTAVLLLKWRPRTVV